MTNFFKSMSKIERIKAKVRGEIGKTSPIAMLAVIADEVRQMRLDLQSSRSAYMRIESGDFSAIAKLEDEPMSDVEDLDLFNEIVKKIAGMRSNEERVRMCSKVLAAIRAAIAGWQSKIDKFSQMSSLRGNSANEIATATVKIETFKAVVKSLRDRGEIICQAHDAAVKDLETFIARDRRHYEPMYHNEKSK